MATYSTGITATWNSVTLGEVVDLSWEYGGDNLSRDPGFFSPTAGSVSCVVLGTFPDTTAVGLRGDLSITGGGVDLTTKAVLKTVGAAAEVNGVTRYSVALDIVED